MNQLQDFSVLSPFFSLDECQEYIVRFKSPATEEKLRDRSRIQWDDEPLAHQLWDRVKNRLTKPKITDGYGDEWVASGVNPRFRLVRYEPGQHFGKHEDGYFQKSVNERSFATLMIYLNTIPTSAGGATHFMPYGLRLQPIAGNAVCFVTDGLVHEGESCTQEKFILRTDVMYTCANLSNLPQKSQIFEWKRLIERVDEPEADALWEFVLAAEAELHNQK